MNNIDIVITYVDNQDPIWNKQYSQYISGSNVRRFRQWDNLKYWFRSIAENAKFIRNIYLVVSNIEQVPEWVNQKTVNIVLHKDIIPEKYLPTFNSTTIEMFLCNIDGLSEKFIYSNDDMFINDIISESCFFENDQPIYQLIYRNSARNIFRMQCKNSYNLAAALTNTQINNTDYYYIKHSMTPLLRSQALEIWDKARDKIEWSLSKFREPFNYTQYLFSVYNIMKNKCCIKQINFTYYTLDSIDEACYDIKNKEHKLICVNDCGNNNFIIAKNQLNTVFELRYNTKCLYEL